MMTALELINELQKLPPEIKIVVRGYEDGFNDVLEMKHLKIKYNGNAEWYYGEYYLSDENDAVNAVELFGKNKSE